MAEDAIDEAIHMRLNQAYAALAESKLLLDSEMTLGAINRAYYAMFYALQALVTLNQVVVTKHSGALAFFDRTYIHTGIFPKQYSKILHATFLRRQRSDYGDMMTTDMDAAKQAVSDAGVFVELIDLHLQQRNS